jgi:hypothetical protein
MTDLGRALPSVLERAINHGGRNDEERSDLSSVICHLSLDELQAILLDERKQASHS